MKFNTLVRASGDNPNLLLGWLLETAKEVATGWGWGWRANIAAAGIRERVLKGQENGHTEIGYSRPEDSPRDYVSKVGHIIYCDQEWTGEGVTSVTKKFREATTELVTVITGIMIPFGCVEAKRWHLTARSHGVIVIKVTSPQEVAAKGAWPVQNTEILITIRCGQADAFPVIF